MSRNVFHAFDVFGNIAVVKFPKDSKQKDKKQFASKILRDNKSIKTVVEKTGKFKGRLRKMQTMYIAGEKTKEVLYKENNCIFRFNIDETYFSPRLSNERKEITAKIKKGDLVLVMFAGVAPFPIIIAKNSKVQKVFSNEINRKANKYAELNISLNKVKDKVVLIPGDIKRIVRNIGSLCSRLIASSRHPARLSAKEIIKHKNSLTTQNKPSASARDKLQKIQKKFDVIIMPRPQLKDTFLQEAFKLSKKGTRIYYYDFCKDDEINSVVEKIKQEAKKFRKKIKILSKKKAGEIGPYKIRLRVDFKVL